MAVGLREQHQVGALAARKYLAPGCPERTLSTPTTTRVTTLKTASTVTIRDDTT